MQTVELARGRFSYFAEGNSGGPLVVALHGFPDTPHGFLPMLTRWARSGRRAAAPFLRGYAPSTLEGPFDLDTLADDVLAFADALSPGRRFSLVGHDWGALIAWRILERAPERLDAAIVLSVPHPEEVVRDLRRHPSQLLRSSYIALFQLGALADWIVGRDDFAFIERLLRDWSPSFTASDAQIARIKAALAPGFPAALEYYRALRREALRERPRVTLRTPTLYMVGERDGCIAPEVGLRQLRRFRGPYERRVVRDAGHFVQWEQPDVVADAVLEWIDTFSERPEARDHRA